MSERQNTIDDVGYLFARLSHVQGTLSKGIFHAREWLSKRILTPVKMPNIPTGHTANVTREITKRLISMQRV